MDHCIESPTSAMRSTKRLLGRIHPLKLKMQVLLVIPKLSRWLARLVAALLIVAISACSHTLPRDSGGQGAETDSDDPWRVRGSVEVGPTYGSPQGPYSPRP